MSFISIYKNGAGGIQVLDEAFAVQQYVTIWVVGQLFTVTDISIGLVLYCPILGEKHLKYEVDNFKNNMVKNIKMFLTKYGTM
jgi:hypothetical protein